MQGVVSTPTRRGPTFVRAKVGKTRSRGTDSPLTNLFLSLAVLDTNLDFSQPKNLNPYCAQMRSKGSLRQHLPPPPCGARKNLRAARLLDFFDRCGCSASLHPPLAVLGSASPSTATPSPPNLHNKSQLYFPSKIHYLCNIHPAFPHNVNFPLKKVKY